MWRPLTDPLLETLARSLDDLEKLKLAQQNRLRILTATEPDKDGVMRGHRLTAGHRAVDLMAVTVAGLTKLCHDTTLELNRQIRKHPLYPWVKASKGVGEKTAARLLAVIGDPYLRTIGIAEDGTLVAEPRKLYSLYKYCGYAPQNSKHYKGDDKSVRFNHHARVRAYVVAECTEMQLVAPCHRIDEDTVKHVDACTCSPYRLVYDQRREHTAITRPEWTPIHSHSDALRRTAKAILKDLWQFSRELHHQE